VSIKSLLFIDANQYLELYRTVKAKKLPANLEELQDYIFVTELIVDEMYRGKVRVAASFLADQLKEWELKTIALPVHLVGTADKRRVSIRKKLPDIRKRSKDAKEEFRELTYHVLEQVSQSKDEVSKRLAGVFAKAVPHKPEELERARVRREHGTAPGKATDPLGDQLSWEQLLSQCQSNRKLWIITGDSDYATKHEGNWILNAALYKDLVKHMHPAEPEVFCFGDLSEGLKPGGIGQIEVQRASEATISIVSVWWYDDYDAATRFIRRTSLGPMSVNSEVTIKLKNALSEVLSWRFGDLDEQHPGGTVWRDTWTKEQFEKLPAEYPEPLPEGASPAYTYDVLDRLSKECGPYL
jgi:PIN domain